MDCRGSLVDFPPWSERFEGSNDNSLFAACRATLSVISSSLHTCLVSVYHVRRAERSELRYRWITAYRPGAIRSLENQGAL